MYSKSTSSIHLSIVFNLFFFFSLKQLIIFSRYHTQVEEEEKGRISTEIIKKKVRNHRQINLEIIISTKKERPTI